ncbi:DMT family transporter [Rhodoferax sp. GW822-FHT02A01]|uniref:DMT family transporter n=1 Tax=Rhodoferax sp. GW822-FHT02A01 TaxID=3141537 RepID=UPI00315D957D
MSAVWVLLFSSSLWGLTWWPLKSFAAAGLSGPLLAMLTYGFAGLVGLPWLLKLRQAWRAQTGLLVWIALVGGWGNTAFVSAMVLGDVVRVMLLFYLAPVWSVLGGRLFLGERVSRRRALAVTLSLCGAFLVVGGMAAFAAPPSAADLLAITAGLAFSGNNILARKAQGVPTSSKTIGLLLGCGITSALMLALMAALGAPSGNLPSAAVFSLRIVLLLAAFSLLWMALVTFTWQWSVTRLEAGRSGVIAIAELVVALLSATLSGFETMTLLECMGAALIASAAVLEATDNATPPSPLSSTSLAKDTV